MDTILCERADGIAWVTLNRPETHNAFDWMMQEESLERLASGARVEGCVR
jgi:enoyl-CoA hydratase/carnithine racemase